MGKIVEAALGAFLIGACVVAGGGTQVRAQATTASVLAADTMMNGVIDNLRKSIQDLLDRLDQSVSSGTFLTRMQLQYLLAEIDYRASKAIDKTFGNLDTQQQRFFRDTQQTITDLSNLSGNIADQADTVTKRVEFVLGNTPFGNNEPRLRSHRPRVLSTESTTKPVNLVFDGSWLANGTPTLIFGETTCDATDVKEPQLTFRCPGKVFSPREPGVTFVDGKLSVVQEQGWGDWIWSKLGGDDKVKIYPVSVAVVPDLFAHFEISATHIVPGRESQSRSMAFDTGAEHCVWGRATTLNVTPAGPGWEIDVNSISVAVNSSNDGRHELRNVTSAGFQFYAEARNHGSCRRVLGEYVYRDARGWHNGSISWSESRQNDTVATTKLNGFDLKWGDSKVVPLPARTQSFIAGVALFDGKTRDYNAVARDDFLAIERDDAGSTLKFSPADLQRAFK